AQVQKAQSDLDTSKSALERAKRLYKEGAISEAEKEQAENAYSSALAAYEAALQDQRLVQQASREEDIDAARQSVSAAEQQLAIDKANQKLDVLFAQRVDSAQANYDAAKQAQALAQIALDNTVVRAPFEGRIAGRPTQVGTYVAPGVTIARVVGVEGAYFEAQVSEFDIAKIKTGMGVDVSVDALPGEKTTGTVMAINPQATSAGRLFFVRIRLDQNLPGLKTGMFARGEAKIGTRNGVILLPSTSLIVDGENASIFLANGDKAKRVAVKTGETKDGVTEVHGISAGDEVIVRGQESLADGTPIKVEKPAPSTGA
ncbi:MAG TPA: efflux RND transporter periplasmic adaptor subunit, partial [Fimbriimonadaceae bacterium]|nr:efflux RND transporter periplasmic adaptor subunit [Fimbriimonadaceae bacterium]